MTTSKNRITLAMLMLSFFWFGIACTEEEAPEPNQQNNTGSGGFKPPESNYFKINDIPTPGSADAFMPNLDATSSALSKPFPSPIDGYCNLQFNFNQTRNIRNLIEEGKSVSFPVSTKRFLGSPPDGDSVAINLTVHDQSGDDAGYYYYVAKGGTLYISKINGKLRYTIDGNIQMTGVKNPDLKEFNYSAKVDFSWLEL